MRLTRVLLILAVLLAAVPASAQQTFVPLKSGIVRVSTAPSTTPGGCASVAATAPAQLVQSGVDVGKFYFCDPSASGGTWTQIAMPAGTGDMLRSLYDSNADGTVSTAALAALATALAANGANCPAGQAPLGMSAAGASENCFPVMTASDYDPGVDGAVDLAEWASVAAALAANGGNCAAGTFPLGVDAAGAAESCSSAISGNAATASAFAADPANCSSGSAAGGVTAAGTAESCVDPIVNLGTDPVGTLPGTSGGTSRTTNPAGEVVFGGSSNAQSSDPDYKFENAPSGTIDNRLTLGQLLFYRSTQLGPSLYSDVIEGTNPIFSFYSGAADLMFFNLTKPSSIMEFDAPSVVFRNGLLYNAVVQGSLLPEATDEVGFPHSDTLPAASGCTVGTGFILTSAPSGEQNYFCEDTDADGTGDSYIHPPGGGAPVGSDGALQFNDGGSAGGSDCTSPSGTGISCAGTGEFGTNAADGTWGRITRENTTDLAAPAAVSGVNRVAFYYKTNHQPYIRHTGGAVEQVATSANESGDLALVISGDSVDYQIVAGAVGATELGTFTTAEANSKLSDGDFATLAGTETLTGKTIDCEASGNVCTIIQNRWLGAFGCINGTTTGASAGSWYSFASAGITQTCVTADAFPWGYYAIADGTVGTLYAYTPLPSGWAGTIDVTIKWRTTATTGNVNWQLATLCIASGETPNGASFNTVQNVTDAALGSASLWNDASQASITTTGCAANEMLAFKLLRDGANAQDTIAATADFLGMSVRFRETQ